MLLLLPTKHLKHFLKNITRVSWKNLMLPLEAFSLLQCDIALMG
jgi:hypothetical protein